MTARPVFTEEIAETYDETRPLPRENCRQVFGPLLACLKGKPNARVLDVGCGTGRVLQHLVPDIVSPNQVIGIDASKAMLNVAKKKPGLSEIQLLHQSLAEFVADKKGEQQFDIVICHWLLHCIADWREAVSVCLHLLTDEGRLIWLDEDADLYRALDEIEPLEPHNGTDMVYALFHAYYRGVATYVGHAQQDSLKPERRAGTKLRNTSVLRAYLIERGWTVLDSEVKTRWSINATASWIIEKIVAPRVFTNLRSILIAAHERGLDNLRRSFMRDDPSALHRPFTLNFIARGHYAVKTVPRQRK